MVQFLQLNKEREQFAVDRRAFEAERDQFLEEKRRLDLIAETVMKQQRDSREDKLSAQRDRNVTAKERDELEAMHVRSSTTLLWSTQEVDTASRGAWQ